MDPRDDSGQASIEQLGLMLLVALVLLATTAIAAVAAPGLVNRVTTAMQRSLCVVSGMSCPSLAQQPCPVLRTDRTVNTRLSAGWLRLGDDRALTIERRSDGTYVIGLVEGIGVGAGVNFGSTGLEASADGQLSGRAGRTWRAADRATATALVERLRRKKLPAVDNVVSGLADLTGLADADPAVESYTLSGRAAGDATARFGLGSIVGAGGGTDGGVEVGVQIAAHRREATAYIALDGRVNAFFDALPSASIPQRRTRGRGKGDRGPDAREESGPIAKVLNPGVLQGQVEAFARGTVALRLAPGPRVLEVEVTAIAGAGAGARELHARLDPSMPEVAEALAAWRRSPGDVRRLTALGQAAATSAALDERRYAVASQSTDRGGELALGLSLGLTSTKGLRTMELIEQRSRPVGGIWERRLDCAAA